MAAVRAASEKLNSSIFVNKIPEQIENTTAGARDGASAVVYGLGIRGGTEKASNL